MPPIYSNTPGGGIRSGAGIHRGAGLRGFGAGVLPPLTDGYYFFDPQSLTAGTVTAWDGSLPDSVNDLGLLAEQLTGGAQPTTDGTSVLFNSNAKHFDIPSTTQAGWQIVGTSLGTFAYKVDSDAITELNLLGNLGGTAYRQVGDLYGIILLPDTATAAQVEAARQLLISRGAADGVTGTSLNSFWRERRDIVEFGLVDTSNANNLTGAWAYCTSLTSFPLIDTSNADRFSSAFNNCTSLTSFPLIDTSNASDFSYTFYNCTALTSFPQIDITNASNLKYAWLNCTSLESFPAGMFDNWNPTSIVDGVFNLTWENCRSLNPQSVENILVSIATSGKYATTSGASGGTALADSEIDIDYDGTGLTSATNTAITTLKSRGWGIRINGVLQ